MKSLFKIIVLPILSKQQLGYAMKKMICLSMLLLSIGAEARECNEGEMVTLAVPFQAMTPGTGAIKRFEVGTQFQLDRIDAYSGRYLVEMSHVKGKGVTAITNPQTGDIVGCAVQTQRIASVRTCVGAPGYCSATFNPKQLVFNECSLNP